MSTTSTAVQAPPAGRCAINPAGSSVTFVTRHMFGVGKVRGRLKVLTVKGRTAPVELTVDGVSAEGAAIVVRADCTVDRYAHGITMMPGMAARRLSVQVAARHTSLATPRITTACHHPERRHE